MCSYHWGQLPKPYRDKVWKHYRQGQEIDKKPSKAYLLAAQEAIDYMAQKEGYVKERANE